MKDKVLVSVLLPATRRRYEFRVPLDMVVEEAARMVSEILGSRERGSYLPGAAPALVLIDPASGAAGELLNPREIVRNLVEQGTLVDGSSLALA